MTTYTLDAVAAGRSERADAPEPITVDGNDLQAAAESVAERHMRTGSPEFRDWCNDHVDNDTFAAMVSGVLGSHQDLQTARGIVDALRTEFVETIIDDYLGMQRSVRLAHEVRKELA